MLRLCVLLFILCTIQGPLLSHKTTPTKGTRRKNKHMVQHIGKKAVRVANPAHFFQRADVRHCSCYQIRGNHCLPASNLRDRVSASTLASDSDISLERYPQTIQSHHLSQLSHLHRRGTFPLLRELQDSKALQSTHGCCCAPLPQSRKEYAEAGTAGWASASDKYNESHPSNQ